VRILADIEMDKDKKHKSILVIDDLEVNLALMKVLLKKKFSDYNVILANGGVKGIHKAISELPDIILLDINMPEMNGFEVCSILKSRPETSHIPILLVSALGQDTSVRVKGLKSGAEGFLTKPFDHAEFEALVKVMLRMKKAEDTLREKNENLSNSLDEIEKYQQKLKQLNTELNETEENERKRLADVLHDGIAQTLSIANIKLSSLKS